MSAFDIFCLPSHHEGLPIALMEALALGLPVVATDVGGVAELVTDGKEAVLVPPRSPSCLAEALVALARDPDRRARDGATRARPQRHARRADARSRDRGRVPRDHRPMTQTRRVARAPGHDRRPARGARAARRLARLGPRRGLRRVLRVEARPESVRRRRRRGSRSPTANRRLPHVPALASSSTPTAASATRCARSTPRPSPAHQGRGIFRRLTMTAVEELTAEGVDFVFNTPNDNSRPGYLRMGWSTVGRLPLVARVAGISSALRMRTSRVPAERWPVATTAGSDAAAVLADPRVGALLESAARPVRAAHRAHSRVPPLALRPARARLPGDRARRRSGAPGSRCSACGAGATRSRPASPTCSCPRARRRRAPPAAAWSRGRPAPTTRSGSAARSFVRAASCRSPARVRSSRGDPSPITPRRRRCRDLDLSLGDVELL